MAFTLSFSKSESNAGRLVLKVASVVTLISISQINLVVFAHTKNYARA